MPPIILSMCLFALAGGISPGPVNVLAASTGARLGFVRALPHVLGASLSYAAIVWLVGSGLGQILQTYPALGQWLQYLGAAYLLYLSARMASARPQALKLAAQGAASGWMQGVLTQSLNPKAWLVAISGVGLFVTAGPDAPLRLLVFCAISGAVCFASVATWAALGQLIRRWLASARYQVWFNRCMAFLLVLAVVSMLWPQ